MEVLMFVMSIFFVGSVQPMLIMCSLIVIALVYSFVVYNVMGGYWFSYVMMMVILSGVLVVFTYMISLMPNESFESYNLVIVVLFVVVFMGMYIDKFLFDMSYVCLDLWLSFVSVLNIFVVGFLLGVMLIVVWLSGVGSGAVRISC